MKGVFTVSDKNFTLGTGNVLWALRTAANDVTSGGGIKVLRVVVGQRGTATSEQIEGEIAQRDTAGTLTMTSQTPRPLHPVGGPASGISGSTAPAGTAARTGTDSSADSGGTYTSLWPFCFNNLNGDQTILTPDEKIWVPAATVIVVRLNATPTGTTGWSITIVYEELV